MYMEHILTQLVVQGAYTDTTMYREHILTQLVVQRAYVDTNVCIGSKD